MKKFDFVKLVSKRIGLPQQQTSDILEEIGQIVVEQCRDKGEDLPFGSIGSFKQKVNPARKGRNPLTGETIEVKESHNIAFRPVGSMKAVVDSKK